MVPLIITLLQWKLSKWLPWLFFSVDRNIVHLNECTLEIPSNEIPSNERSLIRARYCSLQRAADQPLFPHYYGIKRARIWNSS